MDTSGSVNASERRSHKWQKRFAFFDAHGGPHSPEFKPALKKLPFLGKIKINFNFFAFFFGLVYLFLIGLWKKNLTFITIMVITSIALSLVLDVYRIRYASEINTAVSFCFSALYGQLTHYAYYLKEVKGEQNWNPFTGIRW